MTYAELVAKFLHFVAVIKSLNPAYKQPGDGSNGVCDCIGLIIGAIRRMGLKWTGIHGSNYAARYQTVNLKKISAVSQLKKGDIVYKAYEKGNSKWTLPERYWQGHQYYNGDLHDYYHVGVVTQENPVVITHMTSPRMKTLTVTSMANLGNWNYFGKCKVLVNAVTEGTKPEETNSPVIEPPENPASTGTEAVVVSDNGLPVKMREYPSTSCRTWENLIVGTRVTIVDPGEKWSKINGGGRKGWYMMAKFLDVVGDGKGKY